MPDSPDLGEKPKAEAEEPARNPGGADAINDDAPFQGDDPTPLGHDLDPEDNPAVEDELPDEVTQLDDKQQEPEGDDESGDKSDPKEEDPV
jgi:hypothetical protein